MKQLTILAVLILGTLAAQADDFVCTNSFQGGQTLNIHTLPVPKGETIGHATVTLTTTEGVHNFNGTTHVPGILSDYALLDADGDSASLKISTITHHGGRCGRCVGGDEFYTSSTFVKLTTVTSEYDFVCQ